MRSLRVFGFFVGLAVDCGCEGYRGVVSVFYGLLGGFGWWLAGER